MSFTTHPTPRKFYDAAYGDGWSSYTVDNWKSIHNDHENRMQSLRDKVGGHRFIKIDITSLGKRGEDKKMWKVLGDFLDVDVSNIVETRKFPHRYVFKYSAIDQPKRQIRYLFDRIVSKTWFLSIFFV